jgi:hypothetical protein
VGYLLFALFCIILGVVISRHYIRKYLFKREWRAEPDAFGCIRYWKGFGKKHFTLWQAFTIEAARPEETRD